MKNRKCMLRLADKLLGQGIFIDDGPIKSSMLTLETFAEIKKFTHEYRSTETVHHLNDISKVHPMTLLSIDKRVATHGPKLWISGNEYVIIYKDVIGIEAFRQFVDLKKSEYDYMFAPAANANAKQIAQRIREVYNSP